MSFMVHLPICSNCQDVKNDYEAVVAEYKEFKEKVGAPPIACDHEEILKKLDILKRYGGVDGALLKMHWYDTYKTYRKDHDYLYDETEHLKKEISLLKKALERKYPSVYSVPHLLDWKHLIKLGVYKNKEEYYKERKQNPFPTIKIGRRTFYYRDDIVKFLEQPAYMRKWR